MKKQLLAVLTAAVFGAFAANEPLSAPEPSAMKYYLPKCGPAVCYAPPPLIQLPPPPGISEGLWEILLAM